MATRAWLFLCIGGFVSGVALRSFYDFGFSFSFFLLFLGLLVLAYFISLIRSNKRITERTAHSAPGASLCIGVLIFTVGLGMVRFDFADMNHGDALLQAHTEERVIIHGVIVDEPDVREAHTKLVLRADTLGENGEQIPAQSKILLIAEHYPEFEYGDRVTARGVLKKPKNFKKSREDPGRPFDYVSYLAKDGIFYQMFYPSLELVLKEQGNPIKHALFSFKNLLIRNMRAVLPEPHASLLAGITLGAKQALGEDLLQAFRKTGVIHIVVLSGYNITIIADAFGRAAAFLPRVAGFTLSGSAIVLFTIMVGASATVVRASIMAFLVLLARITGRVNDMLFALCIAGAGMVLWNPYVLIFDPSFELSFLATFGLIYLAPKIETLLRWMPSHLKLREIAGATVSTQLFVLPLLLFMMGEASIVSLPVNLLVLISVPFVMFFGFAAAFLGVISQTISLPFGYAAFALLEYELTVVDVFSSLSFVSITLDYFPFWMLVSAYVFYGFIFLRVWKK